MFASSHSSFSLEDIVFGASLEFPADTASLLQHAFKYPIPQPLAPNAIAVEERELGASDTTPQLSSYFNVKAGGVSEKESGGRVTKSVNEGVLAGGSFNASVSGLVNASVSGLVNASASGSVESASGGGLFGNASGGLFGSAAASGSSSHATNGLFNNHVTNGQPSNPPARTQTDTNNELLASDDELHSAPTPDGLRGDDANTPAQKAPADARPAKPSLLVSLQDPHTTSPFVHVQAQQRIHFSTTAPAYTFTECGGGGDSGDSNTDDDEYVFSCVFSDSLMTELVEAKKKRDENERRKKEEEAEKKREEERKKKEEEEREKERKRKEKENQIQTLLETFKTQMAELQKKAEKWEGQMQSRLSSMSSRLTTLASTCSTARRQATTTQTRLRRQLEEKKKQHKRYLRIRASEAFCCVGGSLELVELMKLPSMKRRCVTSWKPRSAEVVEEAVPLTLDLSVQRDCTIRAYFCHSTNTSSFEFSQFLSRFSSSSVTRNGVRFSVEVVTDAAATHDLTVRLHVLRPRLPPSDVEGYCAQQAVGEGGGVYV